MMLSGGAVGGLDSPQEKLGGLLADPARADLDGGQRRAVVRRLRDIVEADHRAVAAGDEAAVGEPDQHAEGADVVVAEDRGRVVRARRVSSRAHGLLAFLAGRQAIDDRPDGQAVARQGLAIGMGAVAGGRGAASAADEGEAAMAEPDEMLGGQRHAEAEIGADMVAHRAGRGGAASAPPAGRGDAAARRCPGSVPSAGLSSSPSTRCSRIRSMKRSWRSRRFRRVGEKGDPAGAIQRLVDPGGELGIEGVGDLADDQPDRLGQARPQIGGGAVIDIAERGRWRSWTRSRVGRATSGLLRRTSETVAGETPARLAMSFTVARFCMRSVPALPVSPIGPRCFGATSRFRSI